MMCESFTDSRNHHRRRYGPVCTRRPPDRPVVPVGLFVRGRSLARFTLMLCVALLLALAGVTGLTDGSVVSAQGVTCDPATDVGGVVFRDYNANGIQDSNELGIDGTNVPVTVTARGPNNAVLGTTTLDADGTYSLGMLELTNGARIEFSGLPDWMQPGAVGSSSVISATSGTLVQFVSVADCDVDLGVNNPAQYCEENPDLATSCFINGDPLAGGTSAEGDAFVSWEYNYNGWWFDYEEFPPNAPPPTKLAINEQIGPVWGIAYQRSTQTIFTAAMLKRHTDFGPLGIGGLYAIDHSNPVSPTVTEFLDLNTLPEVSTGTFTRTTPLPADLGSSSYDPEAFDAVGKVALGDIDISEDEETLYIMNLNNNGELLVLDIASKMLIEQIAVPDPGCLSTIDGIATPAPQDRRPWAVKVHDGEVYIGVVCSAQSSSQPVEGLPSAEDLHAYIMRLDGATFTTVFDFPLDYPKGIVSTNRADSAERTGWFPWTNDFDITLSVNGETLMYPQPILANIEFDETGSMILGFIDRLGHQGGRFNRNTDLNDDGLYNAHSGGDILRACNVNGSFVLQGNPSCPNNRANVEGPGDGEYYFRDNYVSTGLLHNETALGALALQSGRGEVVSTHFDAVRHLPGDGEDDTTEPDGQPRTGGVRFFDNADGSWVVASEEPLWFRSYEVYPDTDDLPGTFAKAAGLGDLELLCAQAPVEIGNRVWRDDNGNGIQDPNEPPLSGVMVELVSPDGQVLETATTDANGQYYFSSDAARSGESTASAIYGVTGLTLNTTGFQVRIPLVQTPLTLLFPTTPNATGDTSNDNKTDLEDSDGISDGTPSATTFAIGAAGANNHNLDFGFSPSAPTQEIFDLALRKVLGAGQPSVVTPGDDVTFTIQVFNQGEITATDIVVVDYIPDGLTLNDPTWSGNTTIVSQTIPGPLFPNASTTLDIVFTVNDDVQPGAITNFAEISTATDEEGLPRVDIDSTPDTDRDNDCNPQNDVIDQDGKNNPCTEDEDDHDPEPIQVPLMSLGNRVWLDDGAGGGVADNGLLDTGEAGIAGVTLDLQDETGAPVPDSGGQPMVTTTDAQGYYLFDNLTPGAYIVCVDAGNFAPGAVLQDLLSSTPTELDPNADVDNNDNGLNDANPAANGICSNAISLTFQSEPVGEPDQGPLGSGDAADNNSNLTLDFGFIPTAIAPGEFDLALRKVLGTGQPSVVTPGDDVTFTIEVFNQGEVTATNIVVADYIPAGLTLNDPTWTGDATIVSQTIPGPLVPGDSTTLDIIFTVDVDATGTITNVAEISTATDEEGRTPEDIDSTPDTNRDNDCNPQDNVIDEDGKNFPCDQDEDDHDPEPIQVLSEFDLALRKVLGADQPFVVNPGDDVTFTIEVFNQGAVTATNIVVVDYIPAGLTLNDPNWTGDGNIISRTIPGPLFPGDSTTRDIIFTVNDDVLPGDIVNFAEISTATDEEGRTPDDRDSTPDTDRDNDCNPQDNVIDEDGKNNPCDEDEDDHDPEPVQVPQMSLGNRVWLDDGAGGGMINNGLIDVGEAGVDNVLLFLLDSEFNAVLGADGLQRSARTNPDGYYLFDELAPGDYVVCVDVRNFQPGAPLEGTDSSVPTEIDPNADMDINDNGLNNPQPTVNGICSGVISLIFVQEPINEPDPGLVGSGGATDNNSNITLDFGFYPLEPTALDETEEPGRRDRILFIPLVRQ